MTKIAICAPACPITHQDAARVETLASEYGLTVDFHPQCFMVDGHFAGNDATRMAAFLDCANDPGVDVVWFARGGYGSNRIAQEAVARLDAAAAYKTYMGYSDMGYMLGALYRARLGHVCHGPMVADGRREGGEAALRRALAYFSGAGDGLEATLAEAAHPVVAFNLTTLAMLGGTSIMPGLAGHVVMIEEVSEHLYAIDRLMFHATAHLGGVAGIRLGRVSDVPDNDRPFGKDAGGIVQDWCARHAIPFLGAADIGHDVDNKIVPFGHGAPFHLASGAQPQ